MVNERRKERQAKKANERGKVARTNKTITGRLFKDIYVGIWQGTMKKMKERMGGEGRWRHQ